VAGVIGLDALSRERVRLTAEDIATATGLDVEVMLGASGAPQTIDLGPGKFGRPQLTLAELWSKKGVAAAIVQAIDRKSVILFGLILVVCVLFLTNAAAAAVRDRRRELAILSCLGWSRRRLAGLIVGEVGVIGLLAGIMSALLARPIATAMHVGVSAGRAWLSVPVAIGLCTVAAAVPAWRASQTHPAGAVHRASATPGQRGGRPRRGVLGLALANLRRTPGRTALGAVALAVGIGGLTLVAAITWAFHGTITGTLLGDAVSIRVRGVDLIAVVATVLIGVVAVADVLYLNVRDRAAELAALQATGWSDAALGRLIMYEGLGIGTIGAIVGAGAGLGAAAMFVGQPPIGLLWTVAITVGVGPLLAAAAAVIPAVLQRRVPMSILLAEE
jgi:ABC-type antimicrobial peptide transport system permease subunit